MLFQRLLVLSILLLSLTRSEKDKLSNKSMLTQTEGYSTDMFLDASSGLYNSNSLFKEDTTYIYDESTVKLPNSTKSNTERVNENIVVSSTIDTFNPNRNWLRNQKTLADQFWYIYYSNLSVIPLSYHSQSFCSKLYRIFIFADRSLESMKYNDCDQRKTRALEIAGLKFIRLFNESFQQDNTCKQMQNICINVLESFIKKQKVTNVSRVSWNNLLKDLNLDSIIINKSLSPCLFAARYEILYNRQNYHFMFGIRKPLLCSIKSAVCSEEVYTWNTLNQK